MKLWIPVAALSLALSPLALVHPLRIRGHSMQPVLRDGELRFALRAWAAAPPRRGELWLLDSPEGPAVKRVVALPGQRVEFRDGVLFVDSRRVEPPADARLDRLDGAWNCGNSYFLLGDNLSASRDSRAWGPLPRSVFQARVLGD